MKNLMALTFIRCNCVRNGDQEIKNKFHDGMTTGNKCFLDKIGKSISLRWAVRVE